jgi:hypothetical protein
MAGYGLLGVVAMITSLALSRWLTGTDFKALLLLGAAVSGQGLGFLVIRALMRRTFG